MLIWFSLGMFIQRDGFQDCASSPQTSGSLQEHGEAEQGIEFGLGRLTYLLYPQSDKLIIVPSLTGISEMAFPFSSCIGFDNGITSSLPVLRLIVYRIGCSRRASYPKLSHIYPTHWKSHFTFIPSSRQ